MSNQDPTIPGGEPRAGQDAAPPAGPGGGSGYGAPPAGYGPAPAPRLGKAWVIGISAGAAIVLGVIGSAVAAATDEPARGIEGAPVEVGEGRPNEATGRQGAAADRSAPGLLQPTAVATGVPAPPPPPPIVGPTDGPTSPSTTSPTEQPTDFGSPTPLSSPTGGVVPTSGPTTSPTGPTPGPTETPTPTGQSVELQGGVVVPIPQGWEAGVNDTSDMAEFFSDVEYVFMLTAAVDPADSAAALLAQNQGLFLPDSYSNVQVGQVVTLPPSGSMTSFAVQEYAGTWTGQQGSVDVYGLIWLANRTDGVVLAFQTEAPYDAAVSLNDFLPILDPAVQSYAGVLFQNALPQG